MLRQQQLLSPAVCPSDHLPNLLILQMLRFLSLRRLIAFQWVDGGMVEPTKLFVSLVKQILQAFHKVSVINKIC